MREYGRRRRIQLDSERFGWIRSGGFYPIPLVCREGWFVPPWRKQVCRAGWGDYWPSGGRVYSPGAALILSGNVSAPLFMALIPGCLLLSRMTCGFPAANWGPWLAPVAVTAGLVVYFLAVPKVGGSSFRTARISFGGAYNDSLMLAMALGDEMQD